MGVKSTLPAQVIERRKEYINAPEERFAKLDSIGFQWACGSIDVEWSKMFECVKSYKANTGHCNLPREFKDNLKLGTWALTQHSQ